MKYLLEYYIILKIIKNHDGITRYALMIKTRKAGYSVVIGHFYSLIKNMEKEGYIIIKPLKRKYSYSVSITNKGLSKYSKLEFEIREILGKVI